LVSCCASFFVVARRELTDSAHFLASSSVQTSDSLKNKKITLSKNYNNEENVADAVLKLISNLVTSINIKTGCKK
jgi:hypothetical protein